MELTLDVHVEIDCRHDPITELLFDERLDIVGKAQLMPICEYTPLDYDLEQISASCRMLGRNRPSPSWGHKDGGGRLRLAD
jgi:hypothetical protein